MTKANLVETLVIRGEAIVTRTCGFRRALGCCPSSGLLPLIHGSLPRADDVLGEFGDIL
jgi:hypothetical protein